METRSLEEQIEKELKELKEGVSKLFNNLVKLVDVVLEEEESIKELENEIKNKKEKNNERN